MIPVNRPELEEEERSNLLHAFNSSDLSGASPLIKNVEGLLADFLSVKHVRLVANGTAGLDIGLQIANPGKNSNVVVPNLTIISAVNEAVRRGVKIIVADCELETYCSSANQLLDVCDENTIAVIPTHIYGCTVEVDKISSSVLPRTLVIEDAAETFGVQNSQGKYLGTLGSLGIFSFYVNKNITTGEGGAVVTDNDEIADKIDALRNLGFERDLPRFVSPTIGWNARLSGIQASLIPTQLKRIDKILKKRIQIGDTYWKLLQNHPWLNFQARYSNNVANYYWVFSISVTQDYPLKAKELQSLLLERGIETRRFFCPLSMQPSLINSGLLEIRGELTISKFLWEKGLYLPSGLGTTQEEIEKTCEILWDLS